MQTPTPESILKKHGITDFTFGKDYETLIAALLKWGDIRAGQVAGEAYKTGYRCAFQIVSELPQTDPGIDEYLSSLKLPEQQGWQPMETAPKDGTEILAYRSHLVDGVEVRKIKYTTYDPKSPGYAEGLRDYWWQYVNDKNFCHRFNDPIGWQPLPPTQ